MNRIVRWWVVGGMAMLGSMAPALAQTHSETYYFTGEGTVDSPWGEVANLTISDVAGGTKWTLSNLLAPRATSRLREIRFMYQQPGTTNFAIRPEGGINPEVGFVTVSGIINSGNEKGMAFNDFTVGEKVSWIYTGTNSAQFSDVRIRMNNFGGAGTQNEFSAVSVLSPVPEPETYVMLLAGLAIVGSFALRKEDSAVLAKRFIA